MKEYKGYNNDNAGLVCQNIKVDKDVTVTKFVRVDFIMKDYKVEKFVKATKKVNYL